MNAYITNSKGQTFVVNGAERSTVRSGTRGHPIAWIHETGDEHRPLAIVGLHPDTVIVFGDAPPQVLRLKLAGNGSAR
jgi:hypothetical protein